MPTEDVRPVRKRIVVRMAPEAAFDLFTVRMSEWWPFHQHSIFLTEMERFEFQCHPGGQLLETAHGGDTASWGTVTSFTRPSEVVISWHPGRAPDTAQEVRVTFDDSEGNTTVCLGHEGWDQLGAIAREVREDYQNTWEYVFVNCFGKAARIIS